MRLNPFVKYLISQGIVIVLVVMIFKLIPEKQIAATVAGFLFVLLPPILMTVEYRRAGLSQFWWFVLTMQFWTLFALPILGIRLLNWGVPFDQLSFLGIPGPVLHQWSSKSYMVMMLVTVFGWWRTRKTKD